MSLTQSRLSVRDVFVTNEKSDGLEELGAKQSLDSPTPSESDFPDGGLQGWATVFGRFLMQFWGFGYLSSFGVYQVSIRWIGSLAIFLGDGLAFVSGPLYDRGWFYPLIIVGSLLQSLSLFTLSLTKPDQFCFIGLAYAPSILVVSQYFSKRRTLAISLVTSGTPLGAIIHPIILNHLLNGHVGFSRGVLTSAGFTPSGTSYRAAARECSRDVLFILMTAGATLFMTGFYFPVFYLQLDSIKHGINVILVKRFGGMCLYFPSKNHRHMRGHSSELR
ncbi:hypothetical protein K503DRAFT_860292 [Rhizopogon vinicolor AM-OR11-026]|uniref:MFS general substrate transporter n=1 Tax=Rhizopogon vinicolor AM-OR11-026 TaxID=1314800 RepID=A0A1B7MIS2_9AGAM|nr:hypothetical protein K503DRAFT_860292 [Rhizopogon vinicolor AM-OR11-026]